MAEGGGGQASQKHIADRFHLKKSLGRGGMGRVWLAYDDKLERDVAVKELILPSEISKAERERFCKRAIREAKSAGKLNHPGVVTVHDVIECDGAPWIVMELIRGPSLSEEVQKKGSLPPNRVAHIGLQVLAALDNAHKAGIVHRDVKPSNILLADRGAVLTDFGIATIEGDSTITRSGQLIGTPAFMAPEHASERHATAGSDLWSLGATLYFAVAGKPPYEGDFLAIAAALFSDAPTPVPDCAGSLEPAIRGLLQKDPGSRLRTGAVVDLLDRAARVDGPAFTRARRALQLPTRPGRDRNRTKVGLPPTRQADFSPTKRAWPPPERRPATRRRHVRPWPTVEPQPPKRYRFLARLGCLTSPTAFAIFAIGGSIALLGLPAFGRWLFIETLGLPEGSYVTATIIVCFIVSVIVGYIKVIKVFQRL